MIFFSNFSFKIRIPRDIPEFEMELGLLEKKNYVYIDFNKFWPTVNQNDIRFKV